ncbi:hypothetical protein [Maribellus maritimus]|uniref:hypothetical protein n=1 Tax=Maribellus maritimus TaxID=2870838 RepID=UPI001EE9B9D6|nr:hypothetical protein [Maribellus maritimus]MCG6188414.1 hypothetical protein [Maribellus maritimus]
MKIFLYLVFFILVLNSCNDSDGLVGYQKIDLDPYIIESYLHDAKQLYMDEIYHNENHFNYSDPSLDNEEIDKILKIIQAVYDSRSPQRDTVFDVYQIHGYYCYSFSSVGLMVETERPEIQSLSENVFPTGDEELDNLLTAYGFDSVRTAYSYPNFPWLTVYTQQEFNMLPVEKEFMEIESVVLAEFNKGCIGDGNNITLKRDSDSAVITFSIGMGDCPAGCIYHKYWEFKVTNGKARFIKTY